MERSSSPSSGDAAAGARLLAHHIPRLRVCGPTIPNRETPMRVARIVFALLCTAAAKPALAQQPASPATPAPAAAAPASTPAAGPRLQPEWRRTEATLPAARSQTHTVRYPTLTLVPVVIILVLLIA